MTCAHICSCCSLYRNVSPHSLAIQLDSTFDTKDYGHANFAEMVKALDAIVEVRKGESDHILRLR